MVNLSKVKLVVSDMDGTLLNSKGEVSLEFFSLYQQLKKNNIHFCAASGRQHNSIADKLARITNEIHIIAENGGILKKGNSTLLTNFLSKEYVLDYIPK